MKIEKFLNSNFDSNIESTILLCEPLVEWFKRNQEAMAYYELTKPGCLHFEGRIANNDIIILGRMANACLTCIESNSKEYTEEQKAFNAASSIASLYDQQQEKLSDTAKKLYAIHIEKLEKEETQRKTK